MADLLQISEAEQDWAWDLDWRSPENTRCCQLFPFWATKTRGLFKDTHSAVMDIYRYCNNNEWECCGTWPHPIKTNAWPVTQFCDWKSKSCFTCFPALMHLIQMISSLSSFTDFLWIRYAVWITWLQGLMFIFIQIILLMDLPLFLIGLLWFSSSSLKWPWCTAGATRSPTLCGIAQHVETLFRILRQCATFWLGPVFEMSNHYRTVFQNLLSMTAKKAGKTIITGMGQ